MKPEDDWWGGAGVAGRGSQDLTGLPGLTQPGGEGDVGAQGFVDALPVDAAVAGLADVGEDGVAPDGEHGVGVGARNLQWLRSKESKKNIKLKNKVGDFKDNLSALGTSHIIF